MALSGQLGAFSLDLTLDNSTDWTWQHTTLGWGSTSKGIALQAILWRPLAAGNTILIRDGSTSGPVIFAAKAGTGGDADQRIMYFNRRVKVRPVIKATDTSGLTSVTLILAGD